VALIDMIEEVTQNDLVYWERDRPDGSGGWIYKQPVELKCRWEDVQQEVIGPDGRTRISNSHLIIRGRMLKAGGIVMRGLLVDWRAMPTYPRIPTTTQGGYEVFKTSHVPDFDGSNLLYEAWT
jgi:hypothetical protein